MPRPLVAGGVHSPHTTPAHATYTATIANKFEYMHQSDGSWSAPVSVPCEPRLVVTATNVSAPVASPLENHLPKLRGFRNSEVRMEIAGYLGVRPAAELGRLRAARNVLAALP